MSYDYANSWDFIYNSWVGSCKKESRVTRIYYATVRSLTCPLRGGSLLYGQLRRQPDGTMRAEAFRQRNGAIYRPVPDEILSYFAEAGSSCSPIDDVLSVLADCEPMMCTNEFGLWVATDSERRAAEYAYAQGWRTGVFEDMTSWKELDVICKRNSGDS